MLCYRLDCCLRVFNKCAEDSSLPNPQNSAAFSVEEDRFVLCYCARSSEREKVQFQVYGRRDVREVVDVV